MAEEIRRQLHSILCADVVGYSALMEADEDATVRTLQGCREVFDRIIENFSGRIIHTAGDSVVAVFPSAVEAVDCATEAQTAIAQFHQTKREKTEIRFRMGVNVGDLMITGSDMLGNGINIAARLESIADPGGVLISDSVYRHVRNFPNFQFEDRGSFNVKNISEPVHAYSVSRSANLEEADRTQMSVGRDAYIATAHGSYFLRIGSTIGVGRQRNAESADVVIGFRRASRLGKQSIIKVTNGSIIVRDCGSINGTFLNNFPVREGEEVTASFSDQGELCLGGIKTPAVKGPCRFVLEPIRGKDVDPALKIRLAEETSSFVGEDEMRTEWPGSERDFASTWILATGGLLIGSGDGCAVDLPSLQGRGARARLSPNYRGFKIAPLNGAELTVDRVPVTDEASLASGARIVLDGETMQFRLY